MFKFQLIRLHILKIKILKVYTVYLGIRHQRQTKANHCELRVIITIASRLGAKDFLTPNYFISLY